MSRLARLAALGAAGLLALSGCGSSSVTVGARFSGPAAVVAFQGVTRAHPGTLQTYFAVASSRGDELQIIDPVTESAVVGPGVVFPLVIATAPRPTFLASTSLQDGGSDLLVAAGAGSTLVQLVTTWDEENRISGDASVAYPGVDLSDAVAPGSVILSMVAIPALGPDATGITSAQPGKAWVVVALTGGQLAVVEYQRDPGKASLSRSARPVWVQHLGFEVSQMSALLANDATWRIFCATSDALTTASGATVQGVAEVVAGPPGLGWRVIPLDARAPTRLVAAAYVRERLPSAPDTFGADPKLRVYAVLDEGACGADREIDCGLVTLDEAARALASDPAASAVPSRNPVPAQPFRAPVHVPGYPLGISIALPPASAGNGIYAMLDTNQGFPLQRIAPGSGERYTSAVAAVPSSDGKVYMVDLGRWDMPSDVSLLVNDSTRVRAYTVTSAVPSSAITGEALGLGDPEDETVALTLDSTLLPKRVEVTPGFTRAEQFQVVWQGVLPSLAYRPGVLFQLADGTPAVALQEQLGTAWRVTAALSDPFLGVGDDAANGRQDLAVVTPASGQNVSTCPLDSAGNAVLPISAVLPPDPVNYPGGAVALSDLNASGTHCLSALPRFDATAGVIGSQVHLTVRSGGLVLIGSVTGYAGRPQLGQRYALAWSTADYDATPSSARALARKARRIYYPAEARCPGQSAYCAVYTWWTDPLAPGPAIAFRADFMGTGTRLQDTALIITTHSGLSPMYRKPTTSGALPHAGVAFDRGLVNRADQGVRFYVPFADDQVLATSPGESQGDIVDIR
ncbi:hypothetical protein [Anaeromyxobacter paludicola]|uniref:Lipoprotein n=1 Tax=Anaeromyxobacter paludicola TaxID=2918171 RepID=A0ABM7X892_9BACT|nr:hypothetical protein [Anaeromyxobacter paludicola]BDG08043.1 hypothetical protein AMPC_11560 [Anaeromyxobacter paludicola]